MTAEQPDLFGEVGKRVERVEWGLLYRKDSYLRPSGDGVEIRPSEENARNSSDRLYNGTRGTIVVRRTVVTYTTSWELA